MSGSFLLVGFRILSPFFDRLDFVVRTVSQEERPNHLVPKQLSLRATSWNRGAYAMDPLHGCDRSDEYSYRYWHDSGRVAWLYCILVRNNSFSPVLEKTSWKGHLMFNSNDFFAILRRSGYAAPLLAVFPPLFRLPLLISIFLLLLLERKTKRSRKTTLFPHRPENIVQQEILWVRSLPLWVGCLLLTENFSLEGETIPLKYPVQLKATKQEYLLSQRSESRAAWFEYCLEGSTLLLFLLPLLSIGLSFMPLAISVAGGAILAQICLQKLAFKHYLRVEEPKMQESFKVQEFSRIRIFRSYLPQKKFPLSPGEIGKTRKFIWMLVSSRSLQIRLSRRYSLTSEDISRSATQRSYSFSNAADTSL